MHTYLKPYYELWETEYTNENDTEKVTGKKWTQSFLFNTIHSHNNHKKVLSWSSKRCNKTTHKMQVEK